MRPYLIFGLLVYVFYLLAEFPAAVALRWSTPDSVTFHDVQGTLWHGSASAVSAGNIVLRDTSWDVSPWRLLTGRVAADVKSRLGDSRVNATLIKPFFGNRLHLRNLRGIVMLENLPADTLQAPMTGRIGVNFERLGLADLWPVEAIGSVDFVETAIDIPGERVEIGSFAATFDGSVSDDGALVAILSDTDSPLEIGGTFRLLPEFSYALDATVRAQPGAPRSLADALQFVGPDVGDGRYQLKRAAQLRAPRPSPSDD